MRERTFPFVKVFLISKLSVLEKLILIACVNIDETSHLRAQRDCFYCD